MDEVELESLKKMSKELYTQNQKLKNEIKALQEQVYSIFQQYKIVSTKIEKTLDITKIVDELISGAKSELLIITSVIDKEYLGKLIDKVNSKVEVMIVTSEMDQLKLKEHKPYKETLKAVKSNELIKSFTNPTTKTLMIIKDRERGLISTGALAKDILNLTLNFGFLLSNKNDLNTLIRFMKLHLPRFQKLELIPVEEKKE
ncbi:MAG: TrmB family transcriptional regulator sugar-binding domain-containing protein [Candidatus Helarchaeota archaeon]